MPTSWSSIRTARARSARARCTPRATTTLMRVGKSRAGRRSRCCAARSPTRRARSSRGLVRAAWSPATRHRELPPKLARMRITAPAPVSVERLEARSRERLARAESLLRQLDSTTAPFTKDSVIAPLNDLQVELHNLMAECGIYIAMHPDREVQQLAEKLQREGNELGQRQLQSRATYDALGAIDHSSLGPVDRRFVDVALMDMRRAGALLGPAERDRARAMRAELTRLGQDHARNIRGDTRHVALEGPHELDGLPADFIAAHQPGNDGVIRISTNPPDHQPFMAYAHSDRARR